MNAAEGWPTVAGLRVADVAPEYASPYSLRFETPAEQLLAGFEAWPWSDPSAQAVVAGADWYSPETERRWGSWGPRARRYPAPPHVRHLSPQVARERVLAVAGSLVGLDYQHHHVPAWDPPPTWPWKDVRSGRRGAGVDCSNLIGFAYSYALGIDLPTNVVEQAAMGAPAHVTEGSYDELVAQLRPADIVYLRSDAGAIVHAVLWLGACGVGPTATPLVLDCASEPRVDSRKVPIPAGVRIRPYRRGGWYGRATAFAHRILS